jgi:hypothetical protein|nr:hypothetical protein [Oxalobacteraceae bacterium]
MQKQAHVFSVKVGQEAVVMIDCRPMLKRLFHTSEADAVRSMRAQGYKVKAGAPLSYRAFQRLYPGVVL